LKRDAVVQLKQIKLLAPQPFQAAFSGSDDRLFDIVQIRAGELHFCPNRGVR
jgi:hypothetical protein